VITRIEAGNYRCFRNLSVDIDDYQVLAGANGSGKSTLLDIPMLLGDLLRAERAVDAFLQARGDAPPRANTITDLLHRGAGTDILFAVEARLPAEVATVLASGSTATRRPMPTHMRYELRLEVFNQRLQVAEEYLFLFASDAHPPVAGFPMQGAAAGGRRVPGSRWWPIISRVPGTGTTLSGETTSRARVLELRIEPDGLALASVPADEGLFPAARWFIGLLRSRAVSYDPNWDALRRPAPATRRTW